MKPHPFKGSGPGFECLYLAGSETETRRQCKRQVDDPIHDVHNPLRGVSESIAKAFSVTQGAIIQKEQPQYWPGTALSVWQIHSDAVLALLKKKQAYGDAWQEQGYMGNLARILSKTSRLKNMVWRDTPFEPGTEEASSGSEETLIDTLLDLSALCAFMAANIEEGNRWGRG